MKTKEQIFEHLSKTGYRDGDAMKIMGYLLGANIVQKGERVILKSGKLEFDDFFRWLNEKPRKNKFLDIATNLDYLSGFATASNKLPENVEAKTKANVQFLMENKEFLQTCLEHKNALRKAFYDIDKVSERDYQRLCEANNIRIEKASPDLVEALEHFFASIR